MKTERGEGEEGKTHSKGVTYYYNIVVKEKGRYPVDLTGSEVLDFFCDYLTIEIQIDKT